MLDSPEVAILIKYGKTQGQAGCETEFNFISH